MRPGWAGDPSSAVRRPYLTVTLESEPGNLASPRRHGRWASGSRTANAGRQAKAGVAERGMCGVKKSRRNCGLRP